MTVDATRARLAALTSLATLAQYIANQAYTQYGAQHRITVAARDLFDCMNRESAVEARHFIDAVEQAHGE